VKKYLYWNMDPLGGGGGYGPEKSQLFGGKEILGFLFLKGKKIKNKGFRG